MKKRLLIKRYLTFLICLVFLFSTVVSSAYGALPAASTVSPYDSPIPASFKDVQYKLLQQDNIVQMDTSEIMQKIRTGGQIANLETEPGLTPGEIISETGYIQEGVLR